MLEKNRGSENLKSVDASLVELTEAELEAVSGGAYSGLFYYFPKGVPAFYSLNNAIINAQQFATQYR